MKKEYNLPTKEEYLQPGGHPRCLVYIVDKYNNIYPDINWGELQAEYDRRRLEEYNQEHKQFVLFM